MQSKTRDPEPAGDARQVEGCESVLAASPQPAVPAAARENVERVCLGIIVGAHGVRGAVRIKSFTAEPRHVARYGELEDEAGERHFLLRITGSATGVVIAKVAGITDRNQAEELRGLRLYLPRHALPPPRREEYYHADLLGLDAVLTDGTQLGQVRAVYDFGAGDTLDIARPAGRQPVMVPFTRTIVPTIDLAAGRLVIDPPPGLLEPEPSATDVGSRRPGPSDQPPSRLIDGPRPAPAGKSRNKAVKEEPTA